MFSAGSSILADCRPTIVGSAKKQPRSINLVVVSFVISWIDKNSWHASLSKRGTKFPVFQKFFKAFRRDDDGRKSWFLFFPRWKQFRNFEFFKIGSFFSQFLEEIRTSLIFLRRISNFSMIFSVSFLRDNGKRENLWHAFLFSRWKEFRNFEFFFF